MSEQAKTLSQDCRLLKAGVVRLEQAGHILIITLNRPEARNAINGEVAAALGAALELLNSDDELRVGILTGTGAAFCAGQDLKAFAAGEPVIPLEHPEWGFAGFVSHFTDKPLIAAVNGFAFGGGLELALACDIIVASDSALFALPEVKRGLFAAGGGVPRLTQQMPMNVARQMVLTGEPITAETAARWGLVNQVVEAAELETAALALARAISANAPLAVQASKRIIAAAGFQSTWKPSAWTVIGSELEAVFGSDDAAEGSRAFVDKRDPVWTSK
ncbi:crotonase/enoyl-CoA hydratase family protein [Pseudarthrobacter raffinosi]|uniref:crotonase/enoyl-CoA hydratase family protein n=1 Tax=Pseudarthrobacter raffinosi TaxID=2953651 RepID=UPI00208E8F6A|nr:crotonase/enoyl-CoA hydratase family protein [Pseudarthrobacter sp. MDT3-9]MCO4253338.1 crotonase/enoyl-CoA hydratase family protein [Pseudarthrobacter sp. MDT3-9]